MRTTMLLVTSVLIASSAYAQNPPPASGPLVLERIHDGWVLAPDFKVTDFDDRTGELAGMYGGRVIDNTVFIGGAGYWLANEARDFKLTYGGLVVGWQSPEFGRIRFGGRGLIGAGRATLGFNVGAFGAPQPLDGRLTQDIRFGVPSPGPRGSVPPPGFPADQNRVVRLVGRDDFLVFEPQADLSARITNAIGVSCGVGYRTAAETDILRDRLNGPTANIAVQFGW